MCAVARRPPEQVACSLALSDTEALFVLGKRRERIVGIAAGKESQVAARQCLVAGEADVLRQAARRRSPRITTVDAGGKDNGQALAGCPASGANPR